MHFTEFLTKCLLRFEFLGNVHSEPTVKRSVAETVPEKASVHTGNATFETITALEQDCFATFSKDVV